MNIHDEEKLTKTYDAALMRRLLRYVRPYYQRMALAVALLLVASLLGIAGPYLTKIGIDEHIAHGDYAGLARIALLYLGVLLLEFVFNYARMYMMEWIGQRTMYDLRMEIFSHLQYLPLRFFDRNQVGRLMTRVTSDVQALNEMFSSGLVAVFGDIFTLTGIIIVLFTMNWKLTLVTLGVVPLLFIATQIFKIKVRDAERQIRVRLAKINAFLQENITGMAVVQLFNREAKNFRQFDEKNLDHLEAYRKTIFYHAVFYPVVEWIFALSVALIIWYGGGQVIAQALSFGSLVAFILYMDRFWRPISDLAEKYGILQTAMASSERIFKLLDEPVEASGSSSSSGTRSSAWESTASASATANASNEGDGKHASVQAASRHRPAATDHWPLVTDNGPLRRARGEIEFRNVTFGYRDDGMVLKNVSFKVEAGEKVAIVGATGSGKTTIISLLCNFYTPQQGQILLDGHDIQKLLLEDLRRQIALVLQDVFLFAGTIEENISLGNKDISPARIRQAATDVNALRFIERLPGKFQEPVIERGNSLSVGQKQLLAFARALAYDPAILILDEATSSVDTETELLIQEALARLMQDRTSIIIAHRLSTIQHVDRIIVLHKGQIREMGTHTELLALGGIYYRLYQLQFAMQERMEQMVVV